MKILITTLAIRQKYINAYGGEKAFTFFDYIIDATNVFLENTIEEIFLDEIKDEKIRKIDTLNELVNFTQNNSIDMIFLFHPRDTSNTDKYINFLYKNNIKYSIVSNKGTERNPSRILHPLKIIKFGIKYCQYKIKNIFSKQKAEYLFTNSSFFNMKGIYKYNPKQVLKINHLNTVKSQKIDKISNIGVFVDQYLPFHTEGECAKEKLDGKLYYESLEKYLRLAKQKYKLDEIIILCHPNSLKKELEFIKHHKTIYGDSYSYIKNSKIVFGHYSNALSIAVQFDKKIVSLMLPFLPECRKKDLYELTDRLQIDIEVFENNEIKRINKSKILQNIIRYAYKNYFAIGSDSLIDSYTKVEYKV
ncbi:hypothetical protein ALC152_00580 [Arcobacter sp. 15-2]|uniref:hypothetical protein n=1 Tax=Arcobacter sp. 15-2 TaxID=3374109 RepID=UPI00399C5258